MSQSQMFSAIVNSPITTLSTGIDSSVTTISITDISKVPVAPNLLTISGGENAETIKYTGISGNDLTGCTRGFQSNAQSWNMGVSVMRAFTAYDHDTFKNNIEDHVGNTTTPHGADTASTANKIALRDASGNLTAKQIISDVAIGTAPLQVTSTTKVANLNVEQVDGHDAGTSANNVLVLDGGGLVPAANVPDLAFSKITSGLPATISGYGITDAVNISVLGGNSFIPYNVLQQTIINGNFAINQRVVSGTVTLTAGVYGHDRWKAGASGCTYTFATSANVTTLTITAGSLLQIIEGVNLYTGTYTLSWTGTAQGKIGAGSYGASGITGSVTGGSNLTIEFGVGTLSKAQFNYGSVAVPFSPKKFSDELLDCMRYFEKSYAYTVAPATPSNVVGIICFTVSSNTIPIDQRYGTLSYKVIKRAVPTTTIYPFTTPTNTGRISQNNGADLASLSGRIASLSSDSTLILDNGSGSALTTDVNAIIFHYSADAEL